MKALQVFVVLFLHVALVTPNTQIRPGTGKITRRTPRKVAEKAEQVSSSISSVIDELREKVKALDEQQKQLQTAILFFKGRARSGDTIYLSDGDQGNFDAARQRCANAGGQMASPRNADENEAIRSITNQYGVSSYLGINELEELGTYRYPGGVAISFTNWNPNEPNNFEGRQENCVELQTTGKWNDIVCASTRLIICEFSVIRF